jgi:hypothetical protein
LLLAETTHHPYKLVMRRLLVCIALLPLATLAASNATTLGYNKTLHLVWSAFCNESALQAWDCQWCTGAFAHPRVQLTQYLKDVKAGTQGYVAVIGSEKKIVVAYRGSKNLANTVEDAEFWMVKSPFGTAGVRTEAGFTAAYLSLRKGPVWQQVLSSFHRTQSGCRHGHDGRCRPDT